MRRLVKAILLLELYALVLALVQMPAGVHTDEAKYLLSIPYPHPPLLRSILASTLWMPFQEFFWRFAIASSLVQGVWLLQDIGYVLTRARRIALCLSWLLASSVMLGAGTIMMAPVIGLFGLVCVWLALNPQPMSRRSPALIGLLWFVGLFSAYQSVLYLPLLIGALRSAHASWKKVAYVLGVPLLLLAIYTLTNPLAAASMLKVTTQDAALPLGLRLWYIAFAILVAGSGITTLVGGFGILTGGRKDVLASFVLVLAFLGLTSQGYYGILLTPLLIAGVFQLLCHRKIASEIFVPVLVLMSILFSTVAPPSFTPTSARETMRFLAENRIDGLVLIDGTFGHEWQYEAEGSIGRFTQDLSSLVEAQASAIVCTKSATCEDDLDTAVWVRMSGAPVEVWIRK